MIKIGALATVAVVCLAGGAQSAIVEYEYQGNPLRLPDTEYFQEWHPDLTVEEVISKRFGNDAPDRFMGSMTIDTEKLTEGEDGGYFMPREAVVESTLFEGLYDVAFGMPEATTWSFYLDEDYNIQSWLIDVSEGGYPDYYSASGHSGWLGSNVDGLSWLNYGEGPGFSLTAEAGTFSKVAPIPLPASGLLFVGALGVAGMVTRKRRDS